MSLRLEHVSKAWPDFNLRDINLPVADGEYLALLGPNGAGKTLLLETILGFYKPDTGRILFEGQDVTFLSPEKRGLGYVSQACILFPHMRVRQNVEFGLKMRGVAEIERKNTTDAILKLMGLTSLADRSPVRLSGGERQKVALARVLAVRPKAILLDEPLSSIDEESSRTMKEELRRIHRDMKVTMIHVTHNQVEAFSLAERVAIMNHGQIVQIDKPKSLLSNPADEFVAGFLGYENIFRGKLVKQNAGLSFIDIGGLVIKATGAAKTEECIVGTRPEDVALSLRPVSLSDVNVLRGFVTECIDLGAVVSVSVDAGLKVKATVAKGSFLELNLDKGTEVWVSIRSNSAKILNRRQSDVA